MIPWLMRLEICKKRNRGVRLWLPVFLVWILLLILMVVLSPLILLVALATWYSGFGRSLLLLFPLIWVVVFNLSGLGVDVETKNERIFMNFI